MIRVDSKNWYRLEGYVVPTNEYNYSTPVTNLDGIDIWYTNVELQFQNPTTDDYIHGVNYKIRKFSDYGLNTIEEINANFKDTVEVMREDMAENTGALFYSTPLVITESCVVCYNDALEEYLDRYVIILRDGVLRPMTTILVKYDGPSVTVGEAFNDEYVTVTGYYDDGNETEIITGNYTILNSDGDVSNIVSSFGSNVFTVQVNYGENIFTADFVVDGLRKINEIYAEYTGKPVALNKKPKKKDIIVTANYSDGFSSTVTGWTYSDGNTITSANQGILGIYYLGFTCNVTVNHYAATPTQLKAFYNGPKVEVGKSFLLDYLTVKIYYQDDVAQNSYWETLNSNYYTLDTQTILLEKDNIITVTYTTNNGNVLTTNFIVEGFIPEKEVAYVTAEYVGPPVRLNKSFNPERVVCKAHWNDGTVTNITDFSVDRTFIDAIGANEIKLTYMENSCIFIVTGVEPENTTESSYSPIQVELTYPEMTKLNHRRRGPMESEKYESYNKFVCDSINRLFDIFNELEDSYKKMYSNTNSVQSIETNVLNTCNIIDEKVNVLKGRR